MISKSYITISLTREEYIKLLADASEAQYEPDHPMCWFVSRLMKSASDDDIRDFNLQLRRRHNILNLGVLKPGDAA